MAKKYYWLKLKRDFFKRHDTRIVENMPNGEKYLLFYLKLLVESIDHEGNLRFSDTLPYNDSMLATITETDIDIVRSAIKLFVELGMMDMLDDGTLYMSHIESMIGHETEWAEKKRVYRIQKDTNTPQIEDKTGTIEGQKRTLSDKSKSKSKRLEKDKDIYGECENVLLSKDELKKLKAKFSTYWPLVLSEFSTGKEAKGYKYKNDYAALLRWDFSRILARPAPARGKHCPRCGSKPMGSEDYCTVCAKDSISETDDVQHWVDDE